MQIVQMKGIVKRFAGVTANDHIDFGLEQGEIHALLGENGAGKTTLMRILYGLYHPDEGSIWIKGEHTKIHAPKDAIRLGIGMVTQHFSLVPTLTVAENLALGRKSSSLQHPARMRQEVNVTSSKFGIAVNTERIIRHLSVGEQQKVEILKALSYRANILILDEPTAVLVPQEADLLFSTLRRLQNEGLSIIFISHKLNEVMSLCDRITVLRDGRVVDSINKNDATQASLAMSMVGRESFGNLRQNSRTENRILVQVDRLSALNPKKRMILRNISFTVQAGEILGIAGVSGNGQSELSQVLCGIMHPSSGRILVNNKDVTYANPAELSQARVGRIPEDRHSCLVGDLSVAENLVLDQLGVFSKAGRLDRNRIQANARLLIDEYQIKARANDLTRTLSGGNMQKVILARSLVHDPEVIIAAQPTRGLDVGATHYVRQQLVKQRNRGAAIVLISEDLDEIILLADRIAIIYEGQIIGILPNREATAEKLGLMMAGHRQSSTASLQEDQVGTLQN
jgi:ABC-type uncharacterized transport system ATPase subunit